jgi:hypothetical protein
MKRFVSVIMSLIYSVFNGLIGLIFRLWFMLL